MAAEIRPLQALRAPPGPSSLTPEQRYWRSFRKQQLVPSPHSNPITHISPAYSSHHSTQTLSASSDLFAVTSGTRIQLFSSRTRSLVKTITRVGVDDLAHSGEIRRDGRVILAGGDSGVLQVFDVGSRAILKTWRGEHKQPVWCSKWNPLDLTGLMSASDDRTVRLWDLPSDSSVTTFTGHQDYVRSGAYLPGRSGGLLVTGSYDQTVRVWDPRGRPDRSVMTFKHAAPIESVLPLPSGTAVLSSAESTISVLDLVAARPVKVLKGHHQKTVTSLSLASNGTRVVSGALDGHVKVFDTASWTVVAGSKYSAPILSLSVIPSSQPRTASSSVEDRHIAVGLQSGILNLKTRVAGAEKAAQRSKQKELDALAEGRIEAHDAARKKKRRRTQGQRIRLRGIDYDGHDADLVIDGNDVPARRKLPAWERALRATQYSRALDLALNSGSSTPNQTNNGSDNKSALPDTNMMLTLISALEHRSALRAALSNRTEASLAPLMRWLERTVTNMQHVEIVTRVAWTLADLYGHQLGLDDELVSSTPKSMKWQERSRRGPKRSGAALKAIEAAPDSGTQTPNGDTAQESNDAGPLDVLHAELLPPDEYGYSGTMRWQARTRKGGFTDLFLRLHEQVRRQAEFAQLAEATRGMMELVQAG